jgi:hypothetical protein
MSGPRQSEEIASGPVRVLCLLASAGASPSADAEQCWDDLAGGLEQLIAEGKVVLERIARPTEKALKDALSGEWDVLHVIARGRERSAVHYATIDLESADGSPRSVTAQSLASTLDRSSSLRLVVAQAFDESTGSMKTFGEILAEHGVHAVVATACLRGAMQRAFVSRFYAGAIAGRSPQQLAEELERMFFADGSGSQLVIAAGKDASQPLASRSTAPADAARDVPHPRVKPVPVDPPIAPKSKFEPPVEVEPKKRFDVFLCYNSSDRHDVLEIARKLRTAGQLPWLDVWEMPPGRAWQPLLEEQIGNMRSAAVFVGSKGAGPWQRQEILMLISEFVAQGLPVIPVLLPDAPAKPELPLFLRAMGWVDFRRQDPDPLKALIWGISGKKPQGYTD